MSLDFICYFHLNCLINIHEVSEDRNQLLQETKINPESTIRAARSTKENSEIVWR